MTFNNIGNNAAANAANSVKSSGVTPYAKNHSANQKIVLLDRRQPADEIIISGKAFAQKEIDAETKRVADEVKAEYSKSSETIAGIKAQIQAGTFNVSSADVADAILSRFI